MANTIKVSVLGDVKDINRKLGEVNGKLEGFGKSAKKAIGLVAGAIAAAGVIDFGKQVVQAASDVQQSLGATETVFGKWSSDIIKSSDKAARQFGLSKDDFLTSSNLIATQLKNQGFAGKELVGQTQDLIGVSSDLAATFGGTTSDAVSALSAVLRGEYEQIERYGVSMKKSDVNARLAAKGQDKLTGEALRNAEAMAALDIITQQTKDTQGAFAKESGTLAHQQQVLSAQWDNMKVKIGSVLLPVLTSLTTWINDTGLPALEKFGAWFSEKIRPHLETFGAAIETAWNYVKDFFGGLSSNQGVLDTFQGVWSKLLDLWEQAQPVLAQLRETVVTVFESISEVVGWVVEFVLGLWESFGTKLLGYIVSALSGVLTFLQGVFEVIQGLFNTVLGVLTGDWSRAWEGIKQVFSGLWNMIQGLVQAGWNVIKAVFTAALGIIKAKWEVVWNWIKNTASSIWNGIKSLISSAISTVRTNISSTLDRIKSAWKSAWDNARSTLTTAWDRIKTAVTNAISNVMSQVRGIKGRITGALSGATTYLYDAGKNVIQGLINGIKDMAGRAAGAAKDAVMGAVNSAKGFLGIRSPSTVFKEIGDNVGKGLMIGIANTENKVKKTAGHLAGAVVSGWEEPRLNLGIAGGGAGGGNTYHITVNSLDPSSAEKLVVQAIKGYESKNGKGWTR